MDELMALGFSAGGSSRMESLCGLCTALVIFEEGMDIPSDGILQYLATEFPNTVKSRSGDELVLIVRTVAQLLERQRRLGRLNSHRAFFTNLFQVSVEWIRLTSTPNSVPVASSGASTAGAAPNRSSRGRRSRAAEHEPQQASAPVFADARVHELGEEILRCWNRMSGDDGLLQALPSAGERLDVISRLLETDIPLYCATKALDYLASVMRITPIDDNILSRGLDVTLRMLNGLGDSCGFSPDWDKILCAATRTMMAIGSHQTMLPAADGLIHDIRHRVIESLLRFVGKTWAARPVGSRINLIVSCVMFLLSQWKATLNHLSEANSWQWVREILMEGVAAVSVKRIGNPFAQMSNQHQHEDDVEDADEDEGDGDDKALASTAWVPEDAKVMLMWFIAQCLAGSSPSLCPVVTLRFSCAWGENDTFHMYRPSTCRDIVTAYSNFLGLSPNPASRAVSEGTFPREVLLAPLLQENRQTGNRRPVFLQATPTTGSRVNPSALKCWRLPSPSAASFPDGNGFIAVGDCQPLMSLIPELVTLSRASSSPHIAAPCPALARQLLFRLCLEWSFDGRDTPDVDMPSVLSSVLTFGCDVRFNATSLILDLLSKLMHRDRRWAEIIVRAGLLRSVIEANAEREEAESSLATDLGVRPAKKARGESGCNPVVTHDASKSWRALRSVIETFMASNTARQLHSTIGASAVNQLSANTTHMTENEMAVVLMEHRPADMQIVIECARNGQIAEHVLQKAACQVLDMAFVSETCSSARKVLDATSCWGSSRMQFCGASHGNACCPNGHPLKLHWSAVWLCNRCESHSQTASLSCRACDFDLCQRCASLHNPWMFDVSHCATIGDVFRYLNGHTRGDILRDMENIRDLLRVLVGDAIPTGDLPNVDHIALIVDARTVSADPDGEIQVPMGITVLQALAMVSHVVDAPMLHANRSKRSRLTHRKRHQHTMASAVMSSGSSLLAYATIPLHLPEDMTHAAHPSHQPEEGEGGATPIDVNCLMPSLGFRTCPCRRNPREPPSAAVTPARTAHAASSPIHRAATHTDDTLSTVEDADHVVHRILSVLRLTELPFQSQTSPLDATVTDLVERHAVDVFFCGLEGLPSALRTLLLDPIGRRCVALATRVDIMRYCAAECRRDALTHIAVEEFRMRGTVPVNLHHAPVPHRCEVSRISWREQVAALFKFFHKALNVRSKVEFSFTDEAGTGEGPTQELYTELSQHAVQDADNWMVEESSGARVLFPSAEVPRPVDDTAGSTSVASLAVFHVLGSCFARAFVDKYTMSVCLLPSFWSCVQGHIQRTRARHLMVIQENDLDDLKVNIWSRPFLALCKQIAEEIDALWARRVLCLLDEDDSTLEELDLFFEGDEEIAVRADNVERYVTETIEGRFQYAARRIEEFVNGFGFVADPAVLLLMDPEEADGVLCGHRHAHDEHLFTADELRHHVVGVHGYQTGCDELNALISVLAEFTPLQQSHFIEFISGSPRLPLGGLAGLGRPITVAKKELDCGAMTLPSCNTCFLYLKLPSYKTASIMRERLLVAITEGRKNFSLS